MARRRLSDRQSGAQPDGPYEGVPSHLRHGLIHWFEDVADSGQGGWFSHEDELRQVASLLRVDVHVSVDASDLARAMMNSALQDDSFFLDLIDATLELFLVNDTRRNHLRQLLDLGGSVWTVADDKKSLARVVSDEAQATYDAATAVADAATTELKEAWANAFGRNGDPSDAWDHAIKALEDVLVPVVVPNKDKATLGDVLGQLRSQGYLWRMILPGKDQSHDVAPLVAMLELIWPNHDRHGGNLPKRTPLPEEGRAIVTQAATIMQWHRDGWVVQKR